MVRIRLRKVGLKNQPSYRIVAADKESPRDGRFLENLGHYNPRTEPSTVQIDEARLFHWLSHGAQPSDSVHRLLNPLGTWDRWERYKAGEDLEDLLKEAKASLPEVDPRTRRDDLASKKRGKKVEKKEEVPVEKEKPVEAEVKVEEQPVEEESSPAEALEEVPEAEAAVEETEPEATVEEAEPEAAVEEAEPETAVEEAEPEAAMEAEEKEKPSSEEEAEAEAKSTEKLPEESAEEASEEENEE
jgi:small subunit ribosomal protein S16